MQNKTRSQPRKKNGTQKEAKLHANKDPNWNKWACGVCQTLHENC